MELITGIVIGAALGLVVNAFLVVGSFDRGFDAAVRRRAPALKRGGHA